MERGTRLPQRKGLAEDSPTPSRGDAAGPRGMQWVPLVSKPLSIQIQDPELNRWKKPLSCSRLSLCPWGHRGAVPVELQSTAGTPQGQGPERAERRSAWT